MQFEAALKGHGFTACGKTRFWSCFWVAQRFTAAISGLFSTTALAAAVKRGGKWHFFRKLFSRAVSIAFSLWLFSRWGTSIFKLHHESP
ncbi:MAG: hypothetical protein WBW12_00425 [Terriglobales bacterium]